MSEVEFEIKLHEVVRFGSRGCFPTGWVMEVRDFEEGEDEQDEEYQ